MGNNIANLSFFTSKGGELLYNFFYLAACLIVIFMLFSEWKRTGTKDKLYLLNAFVVMLINLIFVNLSLANETFFLAPPSYFWYPVITLNLQALTLIFITGAFIYPVAKGVWLKKYISYNITIQGLGFCIITPLWLNHYYLLQDFNKFWGAYYYYSWLFLILATTILYLHFYAADYYQDTLLRSFLGILFFNQTINVWKIFFPQLRFTNYIIFIERTLPLAASFTLVLTIYKNIVSSLIKTNEKLDNIRQQLDQSNQELEKKVAVRTKEITEANKELLRFKEFHENILESLTDGILVVNSDGCILAINRAAQSNLNVKNRLVIGKSLERLLPSPPHNTWMELANEVIKTEREKRLKKVHFALPQLDDEIIVNLLAQPLKDKELHKIGMVLTIEFITEKVQLETKIKRSEKLAYMGRIAAGVAHEIRNPLNSISINLQLLRRAFLKTESAANNPLLERLRIVDGEISRLDGIVNEFLQFARPKKINLQNQDINYIIEESVSLITEQAKQANVSITEDLDKKIPPALLDEAQIKQVFLNISINSMQAMAPQGGTLIFKTCLAGTNDGAGEIIVSITDNGKGMSDEEQKKIFEPFFSSKEDGLGLGLAIASQIIEEHKGSIRFESRVGEGTTFIITLPVAVEQKRG